MACRRQCCLRRGRKRPQRQASEEYYMRIPGSGCCDDASGASSHGIPIPRARLTMGLKSGPRLHGSVFTVYINSIGLSGLHLTLPRPDPPRAGRSIMLYSLRPIVPPVCGSAGRRCPAHLFLIMSYICVGAGFKRAHPQKPRPEKESFPGPKMCKNNMTAVNVWHNQCIAS